MDLNAQKDYEIKLAVEEAQAQMREGIKERVKKLDWLDISIGDHELISRDDVLALIKEAK